MRFSIILELLSKDFDIKKNPKISFGRWRVKEGEQLNVLAIIQEEKYTRSNEFLCELKMAYEHFVNRDENKDLKKKSLIYDSYLAKEFSKSKISKDSDYMISAIFSEIASTQKKFDGILYPSVRSMGSYFNIAINPEMVNSKLELTDVAECPIIKTQDGVHICKSDFGANNLQNKKSFRLSRQQLE